MLVAGRRWAPQVALPGVLPLGTRWNSASKTANMVLSGTPTRTASNSVTTWPPIQCVRAVQSRNTGKRYFEITMVDTGDAIWGAGLMDNSAFPTFNPSGIDDAKGVSLYHDTASLQVYLFAQESFESRNILSGVFSNGDVLGFACDLSNRLFWLSRNGVFFDGQPVPASGGISWGSAAGAAMFPAFYATIGTAGTATATINSGSSAFAGTRPTGYAAWGGSD